MTPSLKLVSFLLAMVVGAAGAWQVQDWRYAARLERQAASHADLLSQQSEMARHQQQIEQDKRQALEQRLSVSDQQHTRELSDAQRDQTRLRDRLATADVRLSVLIDSTDSAGGCDVPPASGTGGVVHAARRAQLDPAHAQRIVAITDAGDQGLIALRACQAYAKEVSTPK